MINNLCFFILIYLLVRLICIHHIVRYYVNHNFSILLYVRYDVRFLYVRIVIKRRECNIIHFNKMLLICFEWFKLQKFTRTYRIFFFFISMKNAINISYIRSTMHYDKMSLCDATMVCSWNLKSLSWLLKPQDQLELTLTAPGEIKA